MEGFGPARRTLKPEAVPTLFCFTSTPKRRKLSEARESRAQQHSIVEELLAESSTPAIRDVGTQCSKLNFNAYMQIPLDYQYIYHHHIYNCI